MAKVSAKLELQSDEFNNKLSRAVAQLASLEQNFDMASKSSTEFVGALGSMATASKSMTGKSRELQGAIRELSLQYSQLSDSEKSSPFGKALSSSIDELKKRYNDIKTPMKEIDAELGNNKKSSDNAGISLEALTGKLGLSTKAFGVWGAAIAAGKVALDVAKDAFFASEANIDEWGRVVEESKMVYEGFLTSLNTGDISGFLDNIGSIVEAAREAYNELDRLSTQKAIDNPRLKAQQTENERMRAMLRTGRYIAPNDGRKASMKEGQLLTDAQKKHLSQQLENGLKTANTIIRSEIDQTTKGINALYKEQAAVLKMSEKEFRAGTASMEEFDKRIEGYNKYEQWKTAHTTYGSVTGFQTGGYAQTVYTHESENPYSQYKAWGVFKDDGDLFKKINELIDQRASLQTQNYSSTAQAYRSINTANGISVRGKNGGTTTPKSAGTTRTTKEPTIDLSALTEPQTITYTIDVDDSQLKKLEKMLPEGAAITQKVDIIPGNVTLPEIPEDVNVIATVDVDDSQLQQIHADPLTQEVDIIPGTVTMPEVPEDIDVQATLNIDDSQLQQVTATPLTETVNVVPGDVDIPEVPDKLKRQQITVTVSSKEADQKIGDILNQFGEVKREVAGLQLPEITPLNDQLVITINTLKEVKKHWEAALGNASTQEDITNAVNHINDINGQIKSIQGGNALPTSNLGGIQELSVSEDNMRAHYGDNAGKNDKKGGNEMAKMLSGVENIVSGIEQLGVELPDGLTKAIAAIEGVMSIVQGINTVIGVLEALDAGRDSAYQATVVGSLLDLQAAAWANVAASAIPFANGGIVGAANGIIAGHGTYHGDTNFIRANDGEMIINETDQRNLYDMIHGDALSVGMGGGQSIVRGSDIYLSLRNYMRQNHLTL